MKSIYEYDQTKVVQLLAEQLKSIINFPEWAKFVKTGVHKERPPESPDWWWLRAASILRKVYIKGPIGVNKLRRDYGGRKNRGVKPEHVYKGSGKVVRTILQQLEDAGLLEKSAKGVYKGKVVTKKGVEIIQKAINNIETIKTTKPKK